MLFLDNQAIGYCESMINAVGSCRIQAHDASQGAEHSESIVIDFDGVENIGQGFADEVFRVWAMQNPEVQIFFTNANHFVELMINRIDLPKNVAKF